MHKRPNKKMADAVVDSHAKRFHDDTFAVLEETGILAEQERAMPCKLCTGRGRQLPLPSQLNPPMAALHVQSKGRRIGRGRAQIMSRRLQQRPGSAFEVDATLSSSISEASSDLLSNSAVFNGTASTTSSVISSGDYVQPNNSAQTSRRSFVPFKDLLQSSRTNQFKDHPFRPRTHQSQPAANINVSSLSEFPLLSSQVSTSSPQPQQQDLTTTLSKMNFKSIAQDLQSTPARSQHAIESKNSVRKVQGKKFVGMQIHNLPLDVDKNTLVEVLGGFGQVHSCDIEAGQNSSTAYVRYEDAQSCEWAKSCLEDGDTLFPSYPLSVEF